MKHLLIVDDEPEVIEGLVDILKPLHGVVLHTAPMASQALAMLTRYTFSLVIADIRMPGMNGIEMWEELQKHNPACRVIFLSGVRDFDHIYRIIQSPNARFLTKMEPDSKILATVQEVLQELSAAETTSRQAQAHCLHRYLTGTEAEQADAVALLQAGSGPVTTQTGAHIAMLEIIHAWALPVGERRQALGAIDEWFAGQCKLRSRAYVTLRLEDARLLCLVAADKEDAAQPPLAQMLRSTIDFAEAEAHINLRCAYRTMLAGWPEVLAFFRATQGMADSDDTKSRIINLAQDAGAADAADPQALQRTRVDLQTLHGYLTLGQRENYARQLEAMFAPFADARMNAAPALHLYYSVLALLDGSLDHVADTEGAHALREALQRERTLSLREGGGWTHVQQTLRQYGMQAMALRFPADACAQGDLIASVQRYIQTGLPRDLSLNALSGHFNINPNYLSRLFKETVGTGLHEYITQLRLGMAARLLTTTSDRVHAIATQVGYDSAHTFIRAFRRQYGMTPNEYRTQHIS